VLKTCGVNDLIITTITQFNDNIVDVFNNQTLALKITFPTRRFLIFWSQRNNHLVNKLLPKSNLNISPFNRLFEQQRQTLTHAIHHIRQDAQRNCCSGIHTLNNWL
jgi:hypothetical protein